MKLTSKIILSQLMVSLFVIILGIMLMPEVIYRNFKGTVRSNVSSYSSQIMSNISQKLVEIKRETNVLTADDDLKQKLQEALHDPSDSRNAAISLYLSGFYIRDGIPSYQVLGVYVTIDGTDKTFCSVGFPEDISSYLDENVITEIRGDAAGGGFISPFSYKNDSPTFWANHFEKVYGYAERFHAGGCQGVITVISPYDSISYLIDGMNKWTRSYMLLDGSNRVLAEEKNGEPIDAAYTLNHLQYGSTYQIGYVDDTSGFSVAAFSSTANWKLICRLSRSEILHQNRLVFQFAVCIILIFEVIANVAIGLITRNVLKPLREVSGKMHEVAEGNMHVRIAFQSQDEVGEVVQSFNIMIRKLDQNIRKLIEKENVEQKLRYSILISKIDPHFIYNTMNTITYLAEQKRNEDVVRVNRAMIDILRDRLRIDLDDVFDTIEQEIHVLIQYLTIQQYRFEKAFKYAIDLEPECEKEYIAKNLIQPIVENALLHGILTNKDEDGEWLGGCVYLTVRREEQNIMVQIRDNGQGMSAEQLRLLQNGQFKKERGRHIGFRNISDRLAFLYHGQAKMKIDSTEGEGTTVTLILPQVEHAAKDAERRLT